MATSLARSYPLCRPALLVAPAAVLLGGCSASEEPATGGPATGGAAGAPGAAGAV